MLESSFNNDIEISGSENIPQVPTEIFFSEKDIFIDSMEITPGTEITDEHVDKFSEMIQGKRWTRSSGEPLTLESWLDNVALKLTGNMTTEEIRKRYISKLDATSLKKHQDEEKLREEMAEVYMKVKIRGKDEDYEAFKNRYRTQKRTPIDTRVIAAIYIDRYLAGYPRRDDTRACLN